MNTFSKAYDPATFEEKWYRYWLDRGCFRADAGSAKPPYSIVIPPPNVTGVLHMGHVLNNTIQDILIRRARMKGFETLWLPGTDHAGIATQVVVEKNLKKSEGIGRFDLGRDAFVRRVWDWKEKHGDIITRQLKKLGCSCDWERERFTMDPDYARIVAETFVDLYRKGYVYRGRRMVNWCPVSRTALSDEEVIMKEQKGRLYYFRVEIAEEPGVFLSIATTRPETIPGDSGIAVHPADPRYQRFIGKHAIRPLPREVPAEEKRIPIVGDEAIDREFGTGVLKVTPAHDQLDFTIGERHSLAVIEVIDEGGKMNRLAGEDLAGTDRFQSRRKAANLLEELGSLEKADPYVNNVGFSERADVPIEPRLSEQWFMKYPAADRARKLVASGALPFFPRRWEKVFDHWMANLQDWCISRQLWWGHRIPVWYRGEEIKCQVDSPGEDWTQDPDVLDTWCSSWLWPFATLDSDTLRKFYPTSVLVTAPEILFFWVARMIMAGLEYRNELPFAAVCLHGIVRDRQGRKMSKSLGNSPDPLDLIASHGADALRFGIMRSTPRGQDTLFDDNNVIQGRHFCNKLWNACRFRLGQGDREVAELPEPSQLSPDDRWILNRLDRAVGEIDDAIGQYKFNEATGALYRFLWSEFCDWYLESSKAAFQETDEAAQACTLAIIDHVLQTALRLLHPFLPFITEELWQALGFAAQCEADRGGDTVMNAPWPEPYSPDFRHRYELDGDSVREVEAKHELVREGRHLRVTAGIPSNRRVRFVLQCERPPSPHDHRTLKILLKAESLESLPNYQPPPGTPGVSSRLGDLYLPLAGLVDFETEIARLTKERESIGKEIVKGENRLSNQVFVAKAPPEVVRTHQERLQEWRKKLERVDKNLQTMKSALPE